MSREDDVMIELQDRAIKELRAENKRLRELLKTHRICIRCGKQLSTVESESVHTCFIK